MAIFDLICRQHRNEACHTTFLDRPLIHDIEHLLAHLGQRLVNTSSPSLKISMALNPKSPTSPVSSTFLSLPTTPVSPSFANSACDSLQERAPSSSQYAICAASIRSPNNQDLPNHYISPTHRSFAERMQTYQGTPRTSRSQRNSVSDYKMTLSDDDELYTAEFEPASDMLVPGAYVDAASQTMREEEMKSPVIEMLMRYTNGHGSDHLRQGSSAATPFEPQGSNISEDGVRHSRSHLQRHPDYQPNDQTHGHFRSSEHWSSQCTRNSSSRSTEDDQPVSFADPASHTATNRRSTRKPPSSYPTSIHVPSPNTVHLQRSIAHLATPLVPLISVTTGLPHPDFPLSLLQYHLLTHDQLDSLARWYHQTLDAGSERWMYPTWIPRPWTSEHIGSGGRQDIETELTAKRRRFGRFVGLRGCESPTAEGMDVDGEEREKARVEAEEALAARLEGEWRAAMRRAEEEERLQEKVWRGRW